MSKRTLKFLAWWLLAFLVVVYLNGIVQHMPLLWSKP